MSRGLGCQKGAKRVPICQESAAQRVSKTCQENIESDQEVQGVSTFMRVLRRCQKDASTSARRLPSWLCQEQAKRMSRDCHYLSTGYPKGVMRVSRGCQGVSRGCQGGAKIC